MTATEPEILLKVHAFLKKEGLCGMLVDALYTDAHHSLTQLKQLEPFQRVSINYGEFVMHPDLVGKLADSEMLFAVEAKGTGGDLIRGLAQAQCYQAGVHAAFFCAPASEIGKGICTLARRYNVGLLAVSEQVELISELEFRSPVHQIHEAVRKQIETAGQVSAETYQYNLPTHYLVWPTLLIPERWYSPEDAPSVLGPYPMPKDWRSALRGAQKLGLIQTSGRRFCLTAVGAALKDMLPADINYWRCIHEKLVSKSTKTTLASEAPLLAGAVRLLLLRDPVVNMIQKGIGLLDNKTGNFRELAIACDQIDHPRAVVFFFNPEALDKIIDKQGQVIWALVRGEHFRSRMFYQFKSILKHAGFLEPFSLGGCSVENYQPEQDIWSLRKS